MFNRRRALAAFASAAALSAAGMAAAVPARAAAKTFRIGYQKNGVFLVAKTRKTLDERFAKDGISVVWTEFSFGPPMLEALNIGAIDLATTGDAPPVFSQAAKSRIVYAAAQPKGGSGSAILLPKNSSIGALADLKGKRVAVAKGSSAHNVAAAALESVGLSFNDVTPVYLAPADGQAAFAQGAVDAWAVWDPYYAIAEQAEGVRVLLDAKDVVPLNSYILSNRDVAAERPDELRLAIAELKAVADWGNANKPDVAALFAEATRTPLSVQNKVTSRTSFRVAPMTPDIVAEQQRVADRFHALGLIPRRIEVAEAVWSSGT